MSLLQRLLVDVTLEAWQVTGFHLWAGTMLFGEASSYQDATSLLDMCLEHGVNFFDSAEMYPVPQRRESQGQSEKFLGRWMKGKARCGRQKHIHNTLISFEDICTFHPLFG
jgi:aryl-alcohol dehydrogenase-like predicted oxidoreductase